MSTERNELADEMTGWTVSSGYYGQELGSEVAQEIAEHLIKAGYRKPRTVTTVEELDAVADGSILMSGDRYPMYAGAIWRMDRGMLVRVGKELDGVIPPRLFVDPLPATVLHEGDAS